MTPARSGGGPLPAAALSGLLLAAAAPPSPAPLLAVGALAPWAAAQARHAESGAAARIAAWSGAMLFGVHWALLLLWVPRLVPRVGAWVLPAYLSQVALLALIGAGVGWLLHGLLRRRVPLPLALGLAWGAGEWVRGVALGPLAFPWMGIAVPLVANPELVQSVAWIGERGLAVGLAALNGALASSLLGWRAGPAAVAASVIALSWIVGAARMAMLEPRPVLRALAVQPAIPLELKRTSGPVALAAQIAATDALVPDTVPPGIDLVVLPETALPVVLDGDGAAALRRTVAAWSARAGVPVAVGAYGAAAGGRTNALFLASADPDTVWPRADKRRLVPGVEWSPGEPGSLVPGRGPALLDVEGVGTLGVLICIESAGPESARARAGKGARVLLNVTNDGWLGEAPRWTRTAAFSQHPAHLRLRSIETGLGALRVGNGGLTTVVDPAGRERRLLRPFEPGVAVGEVWSLAGPTPFVRTGDLAGPLAALLALTLVLVGRRRPG